MSLKLGAIESLSVLAPKKSLYDRLKVWAALNQYVPGYPVF